MRKKFSLFIAFIIAITLVILPSEVALAQEHNNGLINIDEVRIKLKDSGTKSDSQSRMLRSPSNINLSDDAIPAKYDPRETDKTSFVRNQGNTGLCWAFSVTTAAERQYYKKTGEHIVLSPAHLGYFLYNRVDDPLGNTPLDRNIISSQYDNFTNIGGNPVYAAQAMANWMGLAKEEVAPFDIILNNGYNGLGYDDDLAYKNSLILESAEFLDTTAEVKSAIINNGAAVTSYYAAPTDKSEFYDKNNKAYYCYKVYNPNHAVAVIGWDDNYPKENFSKAPERDGAWIIQNSWGENWGDEGYFYLSYEDETLENFSTYKVTSADTYDYNYQYDGNAYAGRTLFESGEKAANIFKVKGGSNQLLEAVNLTTWTELPHTLKIAIYTNLRTANLPESGSEAASFRVRIDNPGMYNFRLEDYGENLAYLQDGSLYSIVITAEDSVELGIEAESNNEAVKHRAGLSPNQSFWKSENDSKWNDLYNDNMCLRIKGLSKITDLPLPEPIIPNLEAPSSVKADLYGYDDMLVSWNNVDGATGYYVEYKKSTWSSWKSLGSTTNTYKKVANLADGAKYAFRIYPYVKINDEVYKSSNSRATSYIYTLKKLSTPKVSKSSKYYIKVKWENIYGESGYEIARSTKKSSGYKVIKRLSYKYSSTKIKTTRKKNYYYKVRPYKTVSGKKIYGPWSNVKSYKLR